ncbi:uncharacterized protein LOC117101813 [Anneissia japonica]|uniref:uncharacterized protein LOC117101813 n=1 Tax=Anneissia japonica TaxID=1529436 RepID=UPI001425A6CA|nr:uncharacterized protein LOC117101813 [Anneissia japonica]
MFAMLILDFEKMEVDVSNCLACGDAGQATPLRRYHLNLNDVVQCCSNKQCTYHLQNAKLSNIAVKENANLSESSLFHKASNTNRNSLGASVIQWTNRNSLCWLDASMCVLVMINSLRECINKLKKRCILQRLFEAYDKAMDVYCEDQYLNRILDSTNGKISVLEENVKIDDDLMCQDLPLVESSLDLNETVTTLSKSKVKLKEAINILNNIRDKVFTELQPILKCKVDDEDSPLFAISGLLNESKPFAEHFSARYHLQFHCTLCGYIQVTCFQKTFVSFVEVPTGFDFNSPVMLRKCPECNASQQPSQLVYHRLSQCVMMHFVNGLPHNNLDRLEMFVDGDHYKLIAIMQYKQAPKHFVAWMRENNENLWIKCDDLMSSECTWSNKVPNIPPKEIHIIIFERQKRQCVSCFKQLDYINSLINSTVPVKTPKQTIQKHLQVQPGSCQTLAELPKPSHQIIPHTANKNLSMNGSKFMGFEESKEKNIHRLHTKKKTTTDNVLLDKYLDTCLKGNMALSSASSIAKPKVNSSKNPGNKRITKQLLNKIQSKPSDKVSIVMATIPDCLLPQVCAKNPRQISNRNKPVKLGCESTTASSYTRRKCPQFHTGRKTKFPGYSYGQKVDDENRKLFDGFRKTSITRKESVDLTVPSPNPSITSDFSGASDVQSMEIDTPSECSLDSSGLDSQGSACHKENISLNATLDANSAFTESAFDLLDDNQDDFLSSLLETNFVPIPF